MCVSIQNTQTNNTMPSPIVYLLTILLLFLLENFDRKQYGMDVNNMSKFGYGSKYSLLFILYISYRSRFDSILFLHQVSDSCMWCWTPCWYCCYVICVVAVVLCYFSINIHTQNRQMILMINNFFFSSYCFVLVLLVLSYITTIIIVASIADVYSIQNIIIGFYSFFCHCLLLCISVCCCYYFFLDLFLAIWD